MRSARDHAHTVSAVLDGGSPFAIGSTVWPGLSKLAEECGETLQVIGKLMGTGGDVAHWDGGPPLDLRLEDELADLAAAITFVGMTNGLDFKRFTARTERKLALFQAWHASPSAPPSSPEQVTGEGSREEP